MARQPGLVFGEVAGEYDRVRSAYPAELVDEVCARVGPDRRALEVGAGTGKATAAFVARGFTVTAVEPDPAMAAVLARRVPEARVIAATFETSSPPPGFPLLYSADAWHWTRPDVRWRLAADALAPGGVLALIAGLERVADPAQRQSMLDIYAAYAPGIVVRDELMARDDLYARWPGDELLTATGFTDPDARLYASHRVMSRADYVTYVSTRSQIRMLPAPTREGLLAALSEVLCDEVPLAVQTVLHLARRTAD